MQNGMGNLTIGFWSVIGMRFDGDLDGIAAAIGAVRLGTLGTTSTTKSGVY